MTNVVEALPGHQGLTRIERALVVGVSVAAAGKLALAGATEAYRELRLARYSPGQWEMVTAPSSMVPYIGYALEQAKEMGLEVVLAGGIAKKALADPETVFDAGSKTITVSDNPESYALKNATIVRPDEVTERDIDLFCKYIWIGEGEDRHRVVADKSDPKIAALIKKNAKKLQHLVDEYAVKNGLDIGPELSVFGYDAPYGHDFRLLDYATKTELLEDGKNERLYDNNGNSFVMPVDEQWTMHVGDLIIPVNSPQVQLGRTLNRTEVARERDVADVNRAIKNLKAKGVWRGDMVHIWHVHQELRHAMNRSISLAHIRRERNIMRLANLAGLKGLAPLTGAVEGSDFCSALLRDRRGPVSRIAAAVMSSSEK